jgi:ATP-dependent helicase HrpB
VAELQRKYGISFRAVHLGSMIRRRVGQGTTPWSSSPSLTVDTGPVPTGLPVEAVVADVVAALTGSGTAVLVAPPGAGKTTVVPLRLMADPVLGSGRIVVLEPRRLAARAAARRMADLLGEPVGRRVGYRTRDERVGGRDVRIEVLTEGILVRRIQADPTLAGTSVVVLDEVHERNLVTDLSLALLVDVRRSLRPDLAVLAMSATVDAARAAAVLGGVDGLHGDPLGQNGERGGGAAPVIASDGRQHAVDVGWWPPGPRDRDDAHVARSVLRVLAEEREGDVLVFLPGAGEIGRVARLLAGSVPAGVAVHPLHGSLPAAEQDRALAPSPPGGRRVVLATDIAESSLTVDGVRVVVDAGLARSPRYDPATGLTRLVTRPASQASADQRAGRAGRLGPGVARRLWSEAEHRLRPRFADPEISVVDLAGLALELAVWGSDPAAMAFPDQPPAAAWSEAGALLARWGARRNRRPPRWGGRCRPAAAPRLARMVVEGHRQGQGWPAAVVAAVLDERDVLGGRRSDRSADLAERVALVAAPGRGSGSGSPAVAVARRRAATSPVAWGRQSAVDRPPRPLVALAPIASPRPGAGSVPLETAVGAGSRDRPAGLRRSSRGRRGCRRRGDARGAEQRRGRRPDPAGPLTAPTWARVVGGIDPHHRGDLGPRTGRPAQPHRGPRRRAGAQQPRRPGRARARGDPGAARAGAGHPGWRAPLDRRRPGLPAPGGPVAPPRPRVARPG